SGVATCPTPRLRPAAPRFVPTCTTSTFIPANRERTAAAVPSVEALSTTTIRGLSGSSVSRARVRSVSSRRLYVIITIETRGSQLSPIGFLGSPPPPHAGARATPPRDVAH